MLKEILSFIVYKPEFPKKAGGDFCEGVEVAPQPGEMENNPQPLKGEGLDSTVPQNVQNGAILSR